MDNEKSKHRWTGEAGGSVRGLDSRAMSHTGMGSLPSHRRGPTAMLWERLRHASTAHTLQQKNLRRSRRLPAAAEAVQRGARPVVVGDFPPSRDLPHTVWRWWKAGVRPGQHHLKALLDLADNLGLGLGHLFTERGCVIAGSKTQTGPKHALPGMTPRQMWPFLLYLRSRDTWPSFTTPFSSLNIASKCLLGSVANEPYAISCGGHSLECPSVHEG